MVGWVCEMGMSNYGQFSISCVLGDSFQFDFRMGHVLWFCVCWWGGGFDRNADRVYMGWMWNWCSIEQHKNIFWWLLHTGNIEKSDINWIILNNRMWVGCVGVFCAICKCIYKWGSANQSGTRLFCIIGDTQKVTQKKRTNRIITSTAWHWRLTRFWRRAYFIQWFNKDWFVF